MSKRRRTSLRTNWKNGQPIESLENRVVPAAVAVSLAGTTLTLTSTPGVTNEVVAVKAGAAFTDILVGGKLTTRLDGTDGTEIATIVFNADAGTGDSLSVTGVTTNALTLTLTGVEKLQLNTGDALSDAVTVNSTGATSLTLVTSNVNGDLTLTHNGAITQSGKLIVSDATSITATASAITLKTSGNSFGTLTLIGTDITVNEAGPTHLGGSTSATGDLKVTSTGTITNAGTINVDNLTTLNSNGAAITVNGAFGNTVSLKGTTVTLTDTDTDTDLGKSTATSTLTVTSSDGSITNSGSLTVGGLATFTAGGIDDITLTGSNNFGSLSLSGTDVSVVEKSATDLRLVAATNLMVTSSGAITDSGVITVVLDTTLSAKGKTITLDTATSTFGFRIMLTGTNISLVDDDGDTVLSNVTAKGDLTITSQNGTAGVVQDIGTMLTVSGRITVDANDGSNDNDITLTNVGNNFGSISVVGADIRVTEADASDLFTSTASGLLTLISGGAVTDSGVLTVGGVTTLQAGPGTAGATSKSITLDDLSNSFGDRINLTGANATLVNTTTSELGSISLTSGMTLTSTGAVTQVTNTSISVGGRLTIDAADDITVDGTGTGTDNFGSISLTTTGNAIVREDSASDLFNSDIDGNFELDSTGAVTDSGDVDVEGTTDIDAATTITLDSTGSDYVGVVDLDGTSISFLNNTDTALGEVTIQGRGAGTLTIISDGDILDAGTGNIETGTGLITFNAGNDILINGTGGAEENDFNGDVSLFGDDVTVFTGAATGALELATSAVWDDLSLTVDGALTQSGTVTVADTATINTGANSITLTPNPNEFGRLVLTGGAVDINESGDTDLGISSVSSLKITSSGNIADVGTLTVSGLAEMIAGSGSLVFGSTASNFGSLKLSIRDDIAVTEDDDGAAAGAGDDAGGTVLNGVTTQGSFTLTSAGAVSQSAAVNVSGDVTLVADFNGATAGGEQDITLDGTSNIFGDTATDGITFHGADVTLYEINPTVLSPNLAAPSSATGNLTIRSAGSITADGVVTVGANSFLVAGDTNVDGTSNSPEVISLTNVGNTFTDDLELQGGAVTIHDQTDGTRLSTSTVSSLTLTSPGGDVIAVSATTTTVTNLLSITASGNVHIAGDAHSLSHISITGNEVRIKDTGDVNGTVIDFLDASSDLILETTGNLTASSKNITIDGNTTITASGSVNLDPVFGNDVNVNAGGDVTLDAVGNLILGDITTSGSLIVTATGNVTNDTTDNGFGTLDVNGNVTVDASGTVFIDILHSDSNITGSLTGATTTVTPAAVGVTVNDVTADNTINTSSETGAQNITGTVTGGDVGEVYTVTLIVNGVAQTAQTVTRTSGTDTYTVSVSFADLTAGGNGLKTITATVTTLTNFGSHTPVGTATKTYTVAT